MNPQDVLTAIKPHARPTWSAQLDETVSTATSNGWTLDAYTQHINKTIGPATGTGYVVRTMERLAATPIPKTPTPPKTATLTYPSVTVPMPTWFRDALNKGGTTKDFQDALTTRHPQIDLAHLTHLQNTGTHKHSEADHYLNTLGIN